MSNKYVTFGEIMLRLRSNERERLFQKPELEATFGGGEANVAVSLSIFGEDAEFVSALPDNAVGEAAERELMKYGVKTSHINKVKGSRLGIYYLETGANQRPSLVVYDRANSAIAEAKAADFNFSEIMKGATWFHTTGITPAISQGAADSALEAMKEAKKAGATVSIDLNYRKKLWNYGIQKCLGIEADSDVTKGELNTKVYEDLCAEVRKQFPNVKYIAVTLRESKSADYNGWSAALSTPEGFYLSRHYDITNIVDRVGGGDSFAAGIIYALSHYEDKQYCINFAVASSCLKHSISGDFNLTRLSEVEALCKGDGSGRVQR